MFLLYSSPLTARPPRAALPSSRSFASLEMLSKKDDFLSYACSDEMGRLSFRETPLVNGSAVSAVPLREVGVSEVSAIGDPVAMASLIMSSLLNLAFAVSKS